jgi:hypothetical protein
MAQATTTTRRPAATPGLVETLDALMLFRAKRPNVDRQRMSMPAQAATSHLLCCAVIIIGPRRGDLTASGQLVQNHCPSFQVPRALKVGTNRCFLRPIFVAHCADARFLNALKPRELPVTTSKLIRASEGVGSFGKMLEVARRLSRSRRGLRRRSHSVLHGRATLRLTAGC